MIVPKTDHWKYLRLAKNWKRGFEEILERWIKKHPTNINYKTLFNET